MTINELQNNVIEEFADFDDWMDKYALLIDLGNSLPPLEEKYKTESNLIEGCQSRVWLQADYVDAAVLYAFGTAWICVQAGYEVAAALGVCVFPFVPGDLVKIAAALAVGPVLQSRLAQAKLSPAG